MTRDQLIGALLTVQGSRENFEKLLKRVGYEPPQKTVMDSVNELYSDGLLDYMNEMMKPVLVVDYVQSNFDLARFFNVNDWSDVMRLVHFQPCALVGQSKPVDLRDTHDVRYESTICTYVDVNGYVFNLEVRTYAVRVNGSTFSLTVRQPCEESRLRLNFIEEFFGNRYLGFWD